MLPDRNAPFVLRDYQVNFIVEIRNKLRIVKHVIACAATGSGKSKVFITIAKGAIANGLTVLIVSEAKKIYRQIASELPCIDINAKSQYAYVQKGALHLAMSQTLYRRKHLLQILDLYQDNLLIIADEAHIGTMTNVLRLFPRARMIGFTATPAYRWAKHLPDLYEDIVVGPQPAELVESGHLCKYLHWERRYANLDHLTKNNNGEFDNASQEAAFETTKVYEGLFEDLKTFPYKKCIIFTASIHHCKALYERMKEEGYDKIVMIHSEQEQKEQDWLLMQYTDGEVDICISVGILTKGFDFPSIDLVVLQLKTASLPKYLQMIGRGSRTCEADGKSHFTVLDYGRNFTTHGPWDMPRDWEKLWKKKNSRDGLPPFRECDKCGYIQHISKPKCDNCGYEFPRKIEVTATGESILVEMTGVLNSLSGKRVSELNHIELAQYARTKNNKIHAIAAARWRERLQPGYLKAFSIEMKLSPHWLYNQLQEAAAGYGIIFKDEVIH